MRSAHAPPTPPPAPNLPRTAITVRGPLANENLRAWGDAEAGSWVERVADFLPGVMFLISGLALLAAVAVVPAWLAHHEYTWRLMVMQSQAAALSQQTGRYESFADALRDDDPVVLERLAMTHLRLGMVGKTPLWVRSLEDETGDVGAWLSVPQPELGVDVPFYAPSRNRLVRLVTGPGRPALLLVSLMCIVAGVLFNPRSGEVRQRERTLPRPVRIDHHGRRHGLGALPA